MIVYYKIEYNNKIITIMYDNKPQSLLYHDSYYNVTQNDISNYCECYNSNKSVTISEYKYNVFTIYCIYKDIIIHKKFSKILNRIFRQCNGKLQLHKKIIITSCLNARRTSTGYICSSLIAYIKDNYVIQLKYIYNEIKSERISDNIG